MNYALYLARRLSLSSSGGHKKSPAVKVAVAAVAISVAVMLAAVSIVVGFKDEIRGKIIGFNSHITMYAVAESEFDTDANLVNLDKRLCNLLDSVPYISSYSLELSMPAILKTPADFKGVYIKGLSAGSDVSFLKNSLVSGRMPDLSGDSDTDEVLISQAAADQLRLEAGKTIDTYFVTNDILCRRMKITGIYNTHFDKYDNLFIYTSTGFLQQLVKLKPLQGTAIRIMTDDFDNLDDNTVDLRMRLLRARANDDISHTYLTSNARNQGMDYFQWLDLLDMNVIVVLALMIAVACATLVSGMLILIIDKTRFIGIMRSLGMNNRTVGKVFVYLSMRVALTGLIIGNAIALTLLAVQKSTHIIPLDAETYYFDYVPVAMPWMSFILLNIGIIAVIFLVLMLPSRFVRKISPATAMRYE